MIKIINTYGIFGALKLVRSFIYTKLFFPQARLIRLPFDIRNRKYISIGENFTTGFACRIEAVSFLDKEKNTCITIGSNVQINDNVHIGAVKSVIIEDNVLIASKVFITDHNHGNYSGIHNDSPFTIPKDRQLYSSKVLIEKNVWIGEFVSVLPGVTIGEGSIIGTMSVVNKNIPPFSIAVGSPARVIKKYNKETMLWEKV